MLRLENFKSTNGPNLYVYLSGTSPETRSVTEHKGKTLDDEAVML